MKLTKASSQFRIKILCSLLLIVLTVRFITAQEIPTQIEDQANQIKQEKLALPLEAKKINSHLYDVLKKMKEAGVTCENAVQRKVETIFTTPLLDVDSQGRCHVTLRTTEINPSLLSKLAKLGFEIESSTENLHVTSNHQMISGWAPFDRIEAIARLTPIFHIRPTDKPATQTGSVNTEGDAILRADKARNGYGVTGAGQKVGIISDGCTHLANSQTSGDLPASVDTVINRFSGDEGTALLEIVHDIAPGAELAFADYGNDEADFANNILLLKKAGCTIIGDDVVYHLEPVYEDGVIAQTVENVVTKDNIVYTSSAGNLQLDHYESDFRDNDTDGWHNFASDDETINIQLTTKAKITAVLQWNNKFGKSSDDFDLYIYNEQLTTQLASSADVQDGDDDPVEIATYTNTKISTITIHICIKQHAGKNRNLSVYTFGNGVTPLQYAGGDGSVYGHAGAQNCLAVGAIDAKDPGNNDIQSYSNHGPTRIYSYDSYGNPISFVDRNKPDHVGIDGVQTKVGQLGYFSSPFYGTSAAMPHTAGIAALVREAAPHLNSIQVGETLNQKAVDLGAVGFDSIFGAGRLDAYEAVKSVWAAPPQIAVSPDSFDVTLFKGETTIRELNLTNDGGSDLNFNISWQPVSYSKMANNELGKYTLDSAISANISRNQLTKKSLSELFASSEARSLSAPIRKIQPEQSMMNDKNILLYENFEAGVMPPTGWKTIEGTSTPGGTNPAHWEIDSTTYIFSGNYSATCYWGYNLNEWLITPALDFSRIEFPAVSFWWLSSYFWHVNPNDRGDLFVKVSTDEGATWKALWTFGNIGIWQDFTWYYTIIDLSEYNGASNVRIAFNVVANDNADISIDEVVVLGEIINRDWIQLDPASGTVGAGAMKNIQVSISTIVDSDTLDAGDHFGQIIISSNDPNQQTVAVPLALRVTDLMDIKGQMLYYSSANTPVQNATVQLTGNASKNYLSTASGNYEFLNLMLGNYTITPTKNGETKNAITAYDASLILRDTVGAISLTPYQRIAADVSGNGKVTTYDAALLLQYSVGLITQFPVGADWTFVPRNYAINDANWSTAPRSRSYSPLQTDMLNQDYLGMIYGDVSGNWAQTVVAKSNSIVEASLHDFQQDENDKLILPIEFNFSETAYSGRIKLICHSSNVQFVSCSTDKSPDILLIAADFQNQITVAFAALQPLDSRRLTINLIFKGINLTKPSTSDIEIADVIIDDRAALTKIIRAQTESDIPVDWHLSQNRPNPFNAETAIRFEVPIAAQVRIEIFNLLGQKLVTLIDEGKKAGAYQILWNGLDEQRRAIGSGIYLYKMQAQNFVSIKKMVLVR